jgi:hypothetical protein
MAWILHHWRQQNSCFIAVQQNGDVTNLWGGSNNLVTRHERVRKGGGISPCILNVVTWWVWMVSFIPSPLYPRGRIQRYQFDSRLGVTRAIMDAVSRQHLPLPGVPLLQSVA